MSQTKVKIAHLGVVPVALIPLPKLPECDICKTNLWPKPNKAVVDCKTVYGPWAYMCVTHALTHAVLQDDLMRALNTSVGEIVN